MRNPSYYIELDEKVLKLLENIAKEECQVSTLITQFSDSLDFHDISSASLLVALNKAYESGLQDGIEIGKSKK